MKSETETLSIGLPKLHIIHFDYRKVYNSKNEYLTLIGVIFTEIYTHAN